MMDKSAESFIQGFIFKERYLLRNRGVRAARWKASIAKKFIENYYGRFTIFNADAFNQVWKGLEERGII